MSKTKSDEQRATRRAFLRGSVASGGAAVLFSAGCGAEEATEQTPTPPEPAVPPQPPALASGLPDGLQRRNFVVHGLEPMTLETRRDRFGASPVTPASHFFVRNNLPMPSPEIVRRPDDWILDISGVVAPRSITLRELKTWGTETLATVVQCSGNGRQFFDHETSGSQWGVGAAACAIWTGVPLRTVIAKLGGALEDMHYCTSAGGEVLPEGVDRDSVVVERSIPTEKALEDCLLAWDLNGAPIPLTHGGPLRLIVPGYFGCNQIKYVRSLSFTPEQSGAHIMSSGYRFRPVGESGSPEQPSMWEMSVKSWINQPSGMHPVAKGLVQVHGVAFSAGRGVGKVEVSDNEGESWREVELIGPDLGPYAWRVFAFETTLDEGPHSLLSRATDLEGNVQPEERVENHRGYGHNGWRDLGVQFDVVEGPVILEEDEEEGDTLVGAPPGSIELSEAQTQGRELFVEGATPPCGTCHTLSEAATSGTVGPNLNVLAPSEAQVLEAMSNGVGVMPTYSESLSGDQRQKIAAYIRAVLGAQ
ncbi:MAG: molybdopterin-dependent oxidoreductase [Polyangiales bacterium]